MQQEETSQKSFHFIIISLLALIVIAICAGILILLYLNKNNQSGQQCTYNGKTYQQGEGFKSMDGCNSCSCNNGEVACTLMACISSTPSVPVTVTGLSVTPTGILTQIYFGKPAAENDYNTLGMVPRTTDASGTDLYSYIIAEVLAGPLTSEKTSGLVPVLTLTGASSCGGSSFQYSKSGTTLTVKFCKDIIYTANPGTGGGYAGISLAANARIINSLTQSLHVNGVSTVVIRQKDDSCFAKDAGVNLACPG